MSQDKIKVGDRVESVVDGATVHGVVKSIYVEVTRGGPAAVFKVLVERKGDKDLEEPYEIDTAAHLWSPPDASKPCVECGDVHGPQYGAEVMNAYNRYQRAPDNERPALLLELAKAFADNLNETDLAIPELLHELTAKALEAETALDHMYGRIGRHVLANIQEATKLKSLKDVLGGMQIMNLQDLQNALAGSAKAAPSPLSNILDSFDKKKSGGGHGNPIN